jgi:hypothetical protein
LLFSFLFSSFSCNSGFILQSPFICIGGSLTSTAACVSVCTAPNDSLFTSLVKRFSFEDSSSANTNGFLEGLSSTTVGLSSSTTATFGSIGVIGNGVALSGAASSFLYVPASNLPATESGSWSISFWFKGAENSAGWRWLLNINALSGWNFLGNHLVIATNGNYLRASMGTWWSEVCIGRQTIISSSTSWYNVIVTHDISNNVKIYLNGIQECQGTGTSAINFSPHGLYCKKKK